MFGLFKKQIHESLELQFEDVLKYAVFNPEEILGGESCDEISGSFGEFGSSTNPIPVNGTMGEIKYLGKLRYKPGLPIFFHRLGSTSSQVTSNLIDVYETVSFDGKNWRNLYFSMRHPRRSNKAPKGMYLEPLIKKVGMDLPFAYGTNSILDDFPFSIPEFLLKQHHGDRFGKKMANRAQTFINKFHSNFVNNKPE